MTKFTISNEDFNAVFHDVYSVHGHIVTGTPYYEITENSNLTSKLSNVLNFMKTHHFDKPEWVLIKENNLSDYIKHDMMSNEIKPSDLLTEENTIVINETKFYIGNIAEINSEHGSY